MLEQKLRVGIQEKPGSIGQWIILSLQHVFAMFGATVLVPLITGLDVGVALVASGIGTLIYIACTKGKVPVYLGSSFAYISTISLAVQNTGGFESAYLGLMLVGLIYMFIAGIIYFVGNGWIKKLLPPVVIGPMIIIIGMTLAPVAVSNIGLNGSGSWKEPLVAVITFISVVLFSIKGKGFIKIIPFLLAILVGYVASICVGIVDFSLFESVSFFQLPNFHIIGTNHYNFDFSQLLVFAPLAFVTISEHIGDHVVLGEVTGEDFLTDPGLNKTLLGDGLATFVSGALGGPANTTYGENTGVVAITRVGSVWVIGLAAIFAISLGFFGYIQAFITSIPWAVIGGMTVILYGLIASNGVKVLIKDHTDLGKMKNLVVVSTMLVLGLGNATIQLSSSASLSGMSLAAIVGILLNLGLTYIDKSEVK
jgi:uracil permease